MLLGDKIVQLQFELLYAPDKIVIFGCLSPWHVPIFISRDRHHRPYLMLLGPSMCQVDERCKKWDERAKRLGLASLRGVMFYTANTPIPVVSGTRVVDVTGAL
jgi:hypothetical protein